VVLVGDARVWQDENVVTGERITIFLAEDRSIVEGGTQGRVKGVFYSKGEAAPTGRSAPGAPCKS
jgi:lipopolysaccharide export system protein LptA